METRHVMAMHGESYSEPFLTSQPPHWVARALAYLLMLLFTTLIIAAVVVRIPETISTPFVLTPRLGTDPVRALRRGVVQRVNVAEGQSVTQGETLFVIQSEQTSDQSAELQALQTRHRSANESLHIAMDKFRSQQRSMAEERRKLQGRIEHVQRLMALKSDEWSMAREMAERYIQLRNKGLTSMTALMDRQTAVSHLSGQLEQLRHEDRDTRAAIDKLGHDEMTQWNAHREREQQLQEEIQATEIRLAALGQWVAPDQGAAFAALAPCSGTVLRLPVKATAAIVAEGEILCELACAAAQLQAELQIPQAGAGRAHIGQGVKLLYEAFPYQQFGVKFGVLRWISPATSTTAFRALVDINDATIMVSGSAVPLKAGMGGRADIVLARRSLLSIAFDPIRQLRENMALPPDQNGQ